MIRHLLRWLFRPVPVKRPGPVTYRRLRSGVVGPRLVYVRRKS